MREIDYVCKDRLGNKVLPRCHYWEWNTKGYCSQFNSYTSLLYYKIKELQASSFFFFLSFVVVVVIVVVISMETQASLSYQGTTRCANISFKGPFRDPKKHNQSGQVAPWPYMHVFGSKLWQLFCQLVLGSIFKWQPWLGQMWWSNFLTFV